MTLRILIQLSEYLLLEIMIIWILEMKLLTKIM